MARSCNISPTSQKLALLLIVAILSSLRTPEAAEETTNLQFYMHDIVNGPNPTAVRVAPSQPLNLSNVDPISSMFGSIYIIDDPLTDTPDPASTVLGRAQGLYAMSSLGTEFSLLMSLTYSFISGPYNGSSFSVVGRNPVMTEVREMPIVGGTGAFRLGRGYCLAQTVSSNGPDAVIRYNVTVLHDSESETKTGLATSGCTKSFHAQIFVLFGASFLYFL